ncbi:hypothetical protein C5167_034947 [Papaver somniferum]|uniref:Uncharacterized protein n=1 Tax=Papaver somniferum TaxID=3469 RepID=A0A4Y7KIR6_PAPSO|nr:hypothetical protein C5167_034947 [Papaver somniferum]
MYDIFACLIHRRVTINTVADVCKKLSFDALSHFMVVVPVLCNLLQYEDQKPLIGLLWRLASGSAMAVKMLFSKKKEGYLKDQPELLRRFGRHNSCFGGDAVIIETVSSFNAVERYLWLHVNARRNDAQTTSAVDMQAN